MTETKEMPHVCCDNPDCPNFDIDLYRVDYNDWNECCERAVAKKLRETHHDSRRV